MFRMRNWEPVNPAAIRLLIGDFLTDNLGRELTSDSILDSLDVHGVLLSRLAYDTTIGERIEQLNRAFLLDMDRLLINQARIDRRESAAACAALLDEGSPVMLEGTAGGGKSCVVAQVLSQLADLDVPALVIRLDRLTEADQSAQAIGVTRDCRNRTRSPWANSLVTVHLSCVWTNSTPLSLVSARQQWAWGARKRTARRGAPLPQDANPLACRSFDLDQDAQLRALAN